MPKNEVFWQTNYVNYVRYVVKKTTWSKKQHGKKNNVVKKKQRGKKTNVVKKNNVVKKQRNKHIPYKDIPFSKKNQMAGKTTPPARL